MYDLEGRVLVSDSSLLSAHLGCHGVITSLHCLSFMCFCLDDNKAQTKLREQPYLSFNFSCQVFYFNNGKLANTGILEQLKDVLSIFG